MCHLSPKDVAAQLGISERTVKRMLNEGHLPGFRIGTKLWRTEQGFVDEYVREGQYAQYRHELRRLRLGSAQRSVAKALGQATQKIDGGSDLGGGTGAPFNRGVGITLGLRVCV